MTSIVLEWHNEVAEKLVEDKIKWLHVKAEEIKGLAQTMTPVDTGVLKGSAYVQAIENGWEIGFGGAASAYALEQHENLDYYHDVGQAKFLEMAFIEVTNKIKSGERTIISTWGDETTSNYGTFNTDE